MARRPCIECHRLTTNGTRCHNCQAVFEKGRRSSRPLPHKERARRSKAVAAWVAEHGMVCPGIPQLDRPPHTVTPPNLLTADHVVPVALGGSESGDLVVRCRSCNSAKSARSTG